MLFWTYSQTFNGLDPMVTSGEPLKSTQTCTSTRHQRDGNLHVRVASTLIPNTWWRSWCLGQTCTPSVLPLWRCASWELCSLTATSSCVTDLYNLPATRRTQTPVRPTLVEFSPPPGTWAPTHTHHSHATSEMRISQTQSLGFHRIPFSMSAHVVALPSWGRHSWRRCGPWSI